MLQQPRNKIIEMKRKLPWWVQLLDLYRYTPAPRFQGRTRQSSFRGLVASMIVLIIVLAYAGFTASRYIHQEPSVSTHGTPTSLAPIPFVKHAIIFRRNVPNMVGQLASFYDPAYFTYRFRQWTAYDQDAKPRTVVELGAQPCNVSSWAGAIGGNGWCPVTMPQLLGRYQSPIYTFYQIDVVRCANSTNTTPNGTTPNAVICAPPSAIDAAIDDGRFNLLQLFDTADGEQFEVRNFLITSSLYSLYEQMYHRHTVNILPNLLWRFTTESSMYLAAGPDTTHVKLRAAVHLTVFARLESEDVTEIRSVSTVLDLVGSWYAFFGSIACVFALHLYRYNEEKFYKKCPQWDGFTASFEREKRGTKQHEGEEEGRDHHEGLKEGEEGEEMIGRGADRKIASLDVPSPRSIDAEDDKEDRLLTV